MSYPRKSSLSGGDTIVEVMFSTAIAALVIVLALAIMNRTFGQIQLSSETTFVRQSIDAEAETIRYARDQYLVDPSGLDGGSKLWDQIIKNQLNKTGAASKFGTCTPPPKAFSIASKSNKGKTSGGASDDAVDIQDLSIGGTSKAQTFARIGQGVWIEAVQGNPSIGPNFIDFHIRACWEPPLSGPDNATLGTIVRLYYE